MRRKARSVDDCDVGLLVIEAADGGCCHVVVGADFDADGALGAGGEQSGVVDDGGDAVGEAKAFETGEGEQRGVGDAVFEFFKPCLDVAAKGDDFKIGTEVEDLRLAAERRGAEAGALGQVGQ